jgi:hypothetical protein
LHAFTSSVRRGLAFPCGVTLPSLVTIGGVDCLPKKNFTDPSGFSRASLDSRAALIGNRYLSSLGPDHGERYREPNRVANKLLHNRCPCVAGNLTSPAVSTGHLRQRDTVLSTNGLSPTIPSLLSDLDKIASQGDAGYDRPGVTLELRGTRHDIFLIVAHYIYNRIGTQLLGPLL